MKPERGSEQHAEPVWNHERGGGVRGVGGRWRERDGGCGHGGERSARQEDKREVGKIESVEGKTDMITKETARKNPRWGGRDRGVCSRQRGKRAGKKGSGRTERGRRRRRV